MLVIVNGTNGAVLASRAEAARSPWAQFLGLMGRAELATGAGLVLPGTRGVHTHFMRFPIDVAYYNSQNVVIGVAHALRPWRLSAYHLRARGAIELPAGTLRATNTELGHVLKITNKKA